MITFVIFGLLGFLSAKADMKDQIAATEKKIKTLNKDLSCAVDQNCAALPYGHKACGGPRTYLVVSKKNKNFKEIFNLITALETLERKEVEASGMASTCDIEIEPTVHCTKSQCTTFNEI